jgi:BCD family chlorophyll transporter-like MFS transporter
MGFNLASVSYFSLASELSGEKGRGRTVAVMFFMMIAGIILTSITLSQMVEPYSPEALARSFGVIGVLALILGLLGLIGLEKRVAGPAAGAENYTLRQMAEALLANPQARTFFWYLFLLLIALLGQDILLEPFAAQAFGLPVAVTTRITSIWGVCVLVTLVIAGALEGRFPKRRIAQAGNYGALASFALITASGLIPSLPVFYAGVLLLGLGTGLSTVANLSLMLDMTTARNVGLYIGAWGMANAFSRLAGGLLGGTVRDLATRLLGNLVLGYVAVFALETLLLLAAVLLFLRIDVAAFRRRAEDLSMLERAAMSTG